MSAPVFPDLAGTTALVTGSSRGIGAGLADALEAAGVTVLRHGSPAHAAAEGLLVADLATPEGVEELARAVAGRTDRLDLLVNNAGVELPARLAELDAAALSRTLEVNLAAPLLLTRALLPLLRAGRGRSVVSITSIHDDVPYAGNVAYVASKAGLEAATRTMALELAPEGIRVNSIAPGAIETDINREVIEEMGRERFESWIPLGRVGEVEDLVGALLFLASEASRYVTGTRLLVDGGYSQALLRYGLDH
ncbi:SDR family NAD(P)-dependent oxidoreductase [Homoserinibacter sp. YIM 151385]|uniref:SDR family NAD(P)-dependent oxidoreductase n=1 Tax=Homoserinibacter sp. YIM 151385 TaxID=2985506 RepID=UPI0022F0C42E|nr:SDR family NAD(P)-dependent oxidoreductase [Homoserinibacter sp. YIM 151385]WBU37519.1 SDR family NAD(P)-dependent oxidoreductase [Homoserinibacter sp. YIM 151385]